MVNVQFSGGLDILFGKDRIDIDLPSSSAPHTVHWLLMRLKTEMVDPREDMFLLDDSIRPGILVLINDTDWELLGEEDYVLQPHDNVLFASTLHGG